MAATKTLPLLYLIGYSLSLVLAVPLIVGNSEDSIRILELQRDMWKPRSMKTFVRHNLTAFSEPFQEFSLCYWIRISDFSIMSPHFSYATTNSNSNAILFFTRGQYLEIHLNGMSLTNVKLPLDLYPEMWTHFCHVVDKANYTLYFQGKERLTIPRVDDDVFQPSGIVILGQDQDVVGGGFNKDEVLRGDIGALEMWDFPLSEEDVMQITSCMGLGNRSSVFSLSINYFDVFGNVKESWVVHDYFCRPQINKPRYMVIPRLINLEVNIELCLLLNATLAVPLMKEENQRLYEVIKTFEMSCNYPRIRAWLGIRRGLKNGEWIDMDAGVPLVYNNSQSSLTTGQTESCGQMINEGIWFGANCYHVRCGTCQIKRSNFLILRGLHFESEIEARFYQSGYAGGKPMFLGYGAHVILWLDNAWQLLNRETNETIAFLEVDEIFVPIGLRQWTKRVKNPEEYINLTFSSCSAEAFMCKSGHCIQPWMRCNLVFDCKDGDDEQGCSIVEVPRGYQKYLPPRGPEDVPLSLTPNITLVRVTRVDDIDMVINLELRVVLTWRDGRLNFRNLHMMREDFVSSEDTQRMWQPWYHILNLKEANFKALETTVVIPSAGGVQYPSYNSINRDILFGGEANDITTSTLYAATISCSFDLYDYPFDVQQCITGLRLPREYDGDVSLNVSRAKVRYNGHEALNRYTIADVYLEPSSSTEELKVIVELRRRQGLIFLTTFIPSTLLLLVSWATLFVKLEALNVRAVMALTTLLVLYTLFANFSHTVPQTDVIKLVDVWFFFIISLLFLNIMIHIFIEHLTTLLFYSNRVKPFNCSAKGTAEGIIRTYRLFVFPTAVLLFNAVFWIMIWRY